TKNSAGPKTPRTWGGSSPISASGTSAPAPPLPKAASSACGGPPRIGSSPRCAPRGSRRPRALRPSFPCSSRTSTPPSRGPPPRVLAAPPADPTPAWRRPPRDLPLLLSCRYTRTVAPDNTVRLGPRWLQLPPGPGGRSYARTRVELRECLDGCLVALRDGRVL